MKFTSTKDDYSDAAFEGTVKTASINTDSDFRDKHLKSNDFFNADSFPTLSFKSTSVQKTGDNTYKISGDLTIRDVTRKATWDAVLGGTLKTSRGTLVAWKAILVINRFEYNLKYDKTVETGGLVVSKEVKITINSEFRK